MFCILGAHWHKILEFVPSFPIYGWLAWWCDFFPVGPTFENHPHAFSQKRSSPLEFIFDTCASASSSHLVWLVKLNICGCSLLLGQMYVQQKNMCFAFRARIDTKLLNLSSMDGWPGDATFFLLGQPLKIISMYSAKKGPAPWNLFLTPAPRPLQVTFLVGEAEHSGCSLLLGQIYFQQKKHVFCISSAHWHKIIEFVPSFINYGWLAWWCDFSSVGPTFEDHAHVFSQRKVQPLGFYFWHLRLGLFRSPFCLVKLNICGCRLFQGHMYFQKKQCFAFWARAQDKCTPLQGQMYLWNLFLMSNIRTFSIWIIIAPFPQI